MSALPTLRKYNDCSMQQRQIFKWHQVATFGYENGERRAVWFCCKCASKYCMTFQLRYFACSLHSFNISGRGMVESVSLLRLMCGICTHLRWLLFYARHEMWQYVHPLKHVIVAVFIWSPCGLRHSDYRPHSPKSLCNVDIMYIFSL